MNYILYTEQCTRVKKKFAVEILVVHRIIHLYRTLKCMQRGPNIIVVSCKYCHIYLPEER